MAASRPASAKRGGRYGGPVSGLLHHVLGHDPDALTPWLADAEHSELRGFAAGLRQDEQAVRAALTQSWSSGQVEGQVTRLKLVKRQGYGRAKLDLLRARLISAA